MAAGPLGSWQRNDASTYEVGITGDASAFRRALDEDRLTCIPNEDEYLLVTLARGESRVLFAAARRAGVQIRHLRRRTETLEEFFRRVTIP